MHRLSNDMQPSIASTRRSFFGVLIGSPLAIRASQSRAQPLPTVKVVKDPNCGCCSAWVEHLRGSGFVAHVVESAEVNRLQGAARSPEAHRFLPHRGGRRIRTRGTRAR
jgi:hypothetical protein